MRLCDLDGEKLVIREDDNESVIRERLDAYDRQTRPVLEYYQDGGPPGSGSGCERRSAGNGF